jgi:hypothetical protein
MGFRFKVADGKVAIYENSDDLPFLDPLAHLGRVKFHSELDYLQIVDVKTYELTLPAIGTGGSGQGAGGRAGVRTNLYELGRHGMAGTPFILGNVTVGGITVAFTGSVPCAQGYTDESHDTFARFLSLGVDEALITAHEYSVQTGNAGGGVWKARAEVTVPIEVFITDLLL